MKKLIVCVALVISIRSTAQSIDPVSLIVAKVIKAIDLQVQKLQNQTIWLQQAQQVAEHTLSKTKLKEIADWQERQRELYANYFKELQDVKSVVKRLPQVKQILQMQAEITTEYKRFVKEPAEETQYADLLLLSREILGSLQQVVSSSVLTMKDADRVLSLCTLRDAMNECLSGIKALNKQHIRLTANKVRAQADLQFLQQLNGKL